MKTDNLELRLLNETEDFKTIFDAFNENAEKIDTVIGDITAVLADVVEGV